MASVDIIYSQIHSNFLRHIYVDPVGIVVCFFLQYEDSKTLPPLVLLKIIDFVLQHGNCLIFFLQHTPQLPEIRNCASY
mgnify:CR=1 FL=1